MPQGNAELVFGIHSGWNADYHPRDSSSGDGESMEPAWWRSGNIRHVHVGLQHPLTKATGPGANSEYTGHAMDGELYNPPDVKVCDQHARCTENDK
jgi:hypothetical protein